MGQRDFQFRILNAISQDFSGEQNFPTCLEAAFLIRNALKDPDASLQEVERVVRYEPLIAVRILRMANTVAYNPGGRILCDLSAAIARLGFEVVRTLSLAVALDQMVKSSIPASFSPYAHQAWERALLTSAIARAIARHQSLCPPEEALLAGLVSQIGVFYLLYRASAEAECHAQPTLLLQLLHDWHREMRDTILIALDLPERIRHGFPGTDRDGYAQPAPDNALAHVLSVAEALTNTTCAWEQPTPEQLAAITEQRTRYASLLIEADADIQEVRQALAG